MKERAIASREKVADAKSPADLPHSRLASLSAQYATAAAWAPIRRTLRSTSTCRPRRSSGAGDRGEIHGQLTAVLVDQYIGNLKQYRAIAMDVGDQDGLRFDHQVHTIFE